MLTSFSISSSYAPSHCLFPFLPLQKKSHLLSFSLLRYLRCREVFPASQASPRSSVSQRSSLRSWKMNRCGYQQKSAMGGSEERRMMMVDSMICPKPRRLDFCNPSINDQLRPLRLSINCGQTAEIGAEMGDSVTGSELLDIILRKGRCGGETSGYQVASSPPFYSGSPPSRASNPLIQDAQFGTKGIAPLSPAPPSPSARVGGGCVRMKFGHKPAAVRIEGFDCLSRDRRNCSISAVA